MRYMIGLDGVVWVVLLDQVIPDLFTTDMLGAEFSVTLGKETTVSLEGSLLGGAKTFDMPASAIELRSPSLFATFNTGASSH